MMSARRRAILFAILAALLVAGAGFAISRSQDLPEEQKPALLLLTSLPIVFGEEFSLETTGSETLKRLERRYRVIPIATTSKKELGQGNLLLMAQPFAQPAEDLVALDDWVKSGGKAVLLADPMLERHDSRALDDATRPPPMFADTGLLAHWGVRLDSPDELGPKAATVGGQKVTLVSPGSLSGSCAISNDSFVARCKIGKGQAVVIADADFLEGSAEGPEAVIGELERINR